MSIGPLAGDWTSSDSPAFADSRRSKLRVAKACASNELQGATHAGFICCLAGSDGSVLDLIIFLELVREGFYYLIEGSWLFLGMVLGELRCSDPCLGAARSCSHSTP